MDIKASEVSRAVQDAFKILEYPTMSKLVQGPNRSPTQWVPGEVQHPGRGSDCSPLSSVWVKNGWISNSTRKVVFLLSLLHWSKISTRVK